MHESPATPPALGQRPPLPERMPGGAVDGDGWERLVHLASDLGDGDANRGVYSIVGIVRNVMTRSALDTSPPWVRTLAATQATRMSDEDVLATFQIDGSQLPRLREMRDAFEGDGGTVLSPGVTEEEVIEAEWLLRMMGLPSILTRQASRHLRQGHRARA